jgi:hypothetical protein
LPSARLRFGGATSIENCGSYERMGDFAATMHEILFVTYFATYEENKDSDA